MEGLDVSPEQAVCNYAPSGLRAEGIESVGTKARSTMGAYRGCWWLLHTKPRQEKALLGDLKRREVAAYLPLVKQRRSYGSRLVVVEIPLFPGYMFLCGTGEDRHIALTTNRVVRVIDVADQRRLIAELHQVDQLVERSESVDVYPGLKVGRRCSVTGGSLRGLSGVVLRRRGVSRMYIGVEILGQSAVVEIDCALLEPIE